MDIEEILTAIENDFSLVNNLWQKLDKQTIKKIIDGNVNGFVSFLRKIENPTLRKILKKLEETAEEPVVEVKKIKKIKSPRKTVEYEEIVEKSVPKNIDIEFDDFVKKLNITINTLGKFEKVISMSNIINKFKDNGCIYTTNKLVKCPNTTDEGVFCKKHKELVGKTNANGVKYITGILVEKYIDANGERRLYRGDEAIFVDDNGEYYIDKKTNKRHPMVIVNRKITSPTSMTSTMTPVKKEFKRPMSDSSSPKKTLEKKCPCLEIQKSPSKKKEEIKPLEDDTKVEFEFETFKDEEEYKYFVKDGKLYYGNDNINYITFINGYAQKDIGLQLLEEFDPIVLTDSFYEGVNIEIIQEGDDGEPEGKNVKFVINEDGFMYDFSNTFDKKVLYKIIMPPPKTPKISSLEEISTKSPKSAVKTPSSPKSAAKSPSSPKSPTKNPSSPKSFITDEELDTLPFEDYDKLLEDVNNMIESKKNIFSHDENLIKEINKITKRLNNDKDFETLKILYKRIRDLKINITSLGSPKKEKITPESPRVLTGKMEKK